MTKYHSLGRFWFIFLLYVSLVFFLWAPWHSGPYHHFLFGHLLLYVYHAPLHYHSFIPIHLSIMVSFWHLHSSPINISLIFLLYLIIDFKFTNFMSLTFYYKTNGESMTHFSLSFSIQFPLYFLKSVSSKTESIIHGGVVLLKPKNYNSTVVFIVEIIFDLIFP